jgi:small conductance mechanosensitive channel
MDRVLESVKEALTGNGVDIPFPTHQVLFHDQTEDSDGNRSQQREGWPADQRGTSKPGTIAGAIKAAGQAQGRRPPGVPEQPGP